MSRSSHQAMILSTALIAVIASTAAAQAPEVPAARGTSIAFESDVLSFGINGYSAMLNVSFANGFQVALGTGRYDVPAFLLEGDDNYETAEWKATSTSVQVLRATYRFHGPRTSGPALGAVVLNQNWRLRSAPLAGETRFRPLSVGITGGWYIHLTRHLYVYPTAAFTYNDVVSGSASINGTEYHVASFAPNGSLHMGWAF
ncbi:MAG: hypothetical protein AB7T31_02740 [Gemmatimonadales bacterium]